MKIRLLLFSSVLLFAAGAAALAGQATRHAIGPTNVALAKNNHPGEPNEVITFYADVASIVQQKCQRCHRPNASGPFSLINYEEIEARTEAIRFVLEEKIMPPWYIEPGYGPWANDFGLSDEERAKILAWIDSGSIKGNPEDAPEPIEYTDGWTISEPDAVISIPDPINIRADGYMDYIYVYQKTDFPEDRWVTEVEIRPTAPQVTHHVEIFLESPEVLRNIRNAETREERNYWRRQFAGGLNTFFAADVPGAQGLKFPAGMAKLLPAGAWIKFQLHYTPNGREAIDQTEVGFVFADEPPHREVHTSAAFNTRFRIPPGAKDYKISGEYEFNEDGAILSLMPHTHLRGTGFLYELIYPDGRIEKILPVPRYDFNWQLNYFFETPLAVPAGSKLRATGWFDNSADNPANPDPTREVPFGEQTWDEMMIGFFNWIKH